MTHPWDKHYRSVFILMLLCGIGLCIGGIWVAPLLIPGGVCLAGAFGMYASANVRMYPWHEDEVPGDVQSHESIALSRDVEARVQQNIQLNVLDQHVEFHPHYDMIVRPRNPSLEIRDIHQAKSAPQLTLI